MLFWAMGFKVMLHRYFHPSMVEETGVHGENHRPGLPGQGKISGK